MEQAITERIVNEARSWIGTPFRHQGRTKGQACDCIGLIIMTLNAVSEKKYPDIKNYGHSPDRSLALRLARDHLNQIPPNQIQPGDIIFFSDKDVHFGIAIENGFIHAYAKAAKRVVPCAMTEDWKNKICGVFRVKE